MTERGFFCLRKVRNIQISVRIRDRGIGVMFIKVKDLRLLERLIRIILEFKLIPLLK